MDKNKGIRYAAGACFAGLAVLESISLVQSNSFSIWTLLSFAGFAIIAVSMFASMTTLTAVGAGVLGISVLGVFISLIPVIIDWPLLDWPLKGFFLDLIFMVIYSVILLLVGLMCPRLPNHFFVEKAAGFHSCIKGVEVIENAERFS